MPRRWHRAATAAPRSPPTSPPSTPTTPPIVWPPRRGRSWPRCTRKTGDAALGAGVQKLAAYRRHRRDSGAPPHRRRGHRGGEVPSTQTHNSSNSQLSNSELRTETTNAERRPTNAEDERRRRIHVWFRVRARRALRDQPDELLRPPAARRRRRRASGANGRSATPRSGCSAPSSPCCTPSSACRSDACPTSSRAGRFSPAACSSGVC